MRKLWKFFILITMVFAIGACGTNDVEEQPTDPDSEQEVDNEQEPPKNETDNTWENEEINFA